MSALLLVEHSAGAPDELSLQALAFARGLGEPVDAILVGGAEAAAGLAVETAHVAEVDGAYAPGAWAAAIVETAARVRPRAILAAGTERATEILAHVAARLDLPFAANCIEATPGDPFLVRRQRWGGSLLEDARLHGSPALLTVAPHTVAAELAAGGAGVERFSPALAGSDLAVRVVESIAPLAGGVSLTEARVIVSGGRGVGSAEAFAIIEELAGLLGGAVGCSRVVTSAGWRPHTDQVGQTGTRVSPDLYIACGISGATQHIAGCKGAKKILAINSDPEASILGSADYAVIGDLHEIVPAISAELRRVRGA